ncbi:MAG: folate family ECF transporter S component [Lachnospiraceae bacterium]|nr:folate family ECF transporter S component [Lachnospiraceae bacterium]
MQKRNTQKLVLSGLLAALSILLTRFLVVYLTESIRISLGNIPIMLAGLWFGPFAGVLVGFSADFIGANLFSGFGWYAPMALTPMLFGLISGLCRGLIFSASVSKSTSNSRRQRILIPIIGMVFLCNLLGSIGWTTWCLSGLYGTPFWVLLSARVPLYLAIGILESFVLYGIEKSPVSTLARGTAGVLS